MKHCLSPVSSLGPRPLTTRGFSVTFFLFELALRLPSICLRAAELLSESSFADAILMQNFVLVSRL